MPTDTSPLAPFHIHTAHHARYSVTVGELLTSVKRFEEYSRDRKKKMKKGIAVTGSNGAGDEGMSDNDKIRLQLYLDVEQFSKEV